MAFPISQTRQAPGIPRVAPSISVSGLYFFRKANGHASQPLPHRERPRGKNVGRQRPPKIGGGNLGEFLGENFTGIEVPKRYVLNRSKALDIDARAPFSS